VGREDVVEIVSVRESMPGRFESGRVRLGRVSDHELEEKRKDKRELCPVRQWGPKDGRQAQALFPS
jgi:hypothetical protein